MRDIPMEIYEILIDDREVTSYTGKHIKIDNYPEPASQSQPYIVISEVDDTLPYEYADNDNLALSYLVQVDIFCPLSSNYNARNTCKELSYYVSRVLKEKLGLENTSNAKPEYDKDLKIYRRAKRYEGIFYRQNKVN
ncbi:hypothetical protein BFS35_012125 [Macrococcoides goetzii]|uniref:DUF3168 domain-containing protein n=1 Tax=Macrococcoides goetzii TaxID=1891097 RepID=A0A2G5NV77_9STAP|nr:hypothetical protein [Macrococcus goetzii]RAI79300.1 hypothetical protein BFS35_012125 [Macrococcus goetzii]